MVFDISKIKGIGEFKVQKEPGRELYLKDGRTFLVLRVNTIEIRCDEKLAAVLKEKYESVMESRYFGQGGVEVVLAGQLNQTELEDLIRHSYILTA